MYSRGASNPSSRSLKPVTRKWISKNGSLSAVQHMFPQSGLVFSIALCCKPDSRALAAAPQIRGAVGKLQVEETDSPACRSTMPCFISSSHRVAGSHRRREHLTATIHSHQQRLLLARASWPKLSRGVILKVTASSSAALVICLSISTFR
jgi:hypothetical protein